VLSLLSCTDPPGHHRDHNSTHLFVKSAAQINPLTASHLPLLSLQIDLDTIETSNLNRQFLFRRSHVGQSKAQVAAEVVKAFAPHANITAYQVRSHLYVKGLHLWDVCLAVCAAGGGAEGDGEGRSCDMWSCKQLSVRRAELWFDWLTADEIRARHRW
jgi:hypothetical protein